MDSDLANGTRPRPLIKKLAEVMGAVGAVEKTGRHSQGYAYAKESDIVEAIRSHLSDRHVMVIPDVQSVEMIQRQYPDGKQATPITRVRVTWLLIDGESGDELSVSAFGDGMDSSDKGYYKAMTGCQKYLWMKMLHLPTHDDPENEPQQQQQPTAKPTKKAAAPAKAAAAAPAAAATRPAGPQQVHETEGQKLTRMSKRWFASFTEMTTKKKGVLWGGERWHEMTVDQQRRFIGDCLKRDVTSKADLTYEDWRICVSVLAHDIDPAAYETIGATADIL